MTMLFSFLLWDVASSLLDAYSEVILSPRAHSGEPALKCQRRSFVQCGGVVLAILDGMKSMGPPYTIGDMLDRYEGQAGSLVKTERKCVHNHLLLVMRSIFVSSVSFEGLVHLNQEGKSVSSQRFGEYFEMNLSSEPFKAGQCRLFNWYKMVIEPNLGKQVGEVGFSELTASEIGYSIRKDSARFIGPPIQSIRRIIDLEMRKIKLDQPLRPRAKRARDLELDYPEYPESLGELPSLNRSESQELLNALLG